MAYLGKLKKDDKALRKNIAELVLASEGHFDWDTCWNLEPLDRQMIIKAVRNYNSAKAGKPIQEEM